MDLALHMGMPAVELAQRLSETEFQRWAQYSRHYSLPFRRLELLLAQMTSVVTKVFGSKADLSAADFMLKDIPMQEELPNNVTRMEAARAAFGFRPRKQKK